jgi:hypothetical protein
LRTAYSTHNKEHTMRKLVSKILFALAVTLGAAATSYAQVGGLMFPGPGQWHSSGGGGGPTLSFIGLTTFAPAAGGTQTISGVSIGTASANRRVIVAVVETRSGGAGPTDITIAGTSVGATFKQVDNNVSYNGSISIGYVDVPTGTTATITVVGGATSGDENQDAIYVYTVDKSTLVAGSPSFGSHAIASGSPATSNTVTVNTTASGFVIALLALPGFSSATAQSITSSTETYASDGSTNTQSISMAASKKSGSSTNAPTSVTFSWTNAAGSVAALYAWN